MTNPKLRFNLHEATPWQFRTLDEVSFYAKKRVKPPVCVYVGIEELQAYGAGVKPRVNDSQEGIEFLVDDILLGNIRPYLKKLWQADCQGSCSADVLVIRTKDSIAPKFLKCVLSSDKFFEHIALGYKGSKMPRGDKSQIMQFAFGIPSTEEQQKIADFFSTLDEKIALAERKLAALQTLKSGLMQKIFSREIRFRRENGESFPAWEQATPAKTAVMITVGIANAARHAYCNAESGVPMLRNMNIKPNQLDDSDLVYITRDFADKYSKKTLKENDVLVCRTGVPGTACLVTKKYAGAQTFTTLIVRLLPSVEPRYICQYINSHLAKKYIDSTTIGGGQKNSGAGIISTLPIMLPCREEQQRIAEILTDVDAKIETADAKLALLNRQKQAFMQQMFV